MTLENTGEAIYLATAGTNPSRQRCYAVLTRSANAAAQLVLRTQAERKAATASQSGEMKGEGSPLHFMSVSLDCHPERSEGSVAMGSEMLRCAQHDSAGPYCHALARRYGSPDSSESLSGRNQVSNREAPFIRGGAPSAHDPCQPGI